MRKESHGSLETQVAETFYSLVYGHVKQIHCNLSVSRDLLLLGKGQGGWVCFSAADKDCMQECLTSHWAAGLGETFWSCWEISLAFGKREFCPEGLRRDRGGRGTPPAATLGQSGLRLALTQEPKWQKLPLFCGVVFQ